MTINNREEFTARARVTAELLGPDCIPLLPSYFHKPPPQPDGLENQFTRLGSWMVACQYAIFEILYYLREASLPLLRQVAFGVYDWTQANAVEILCRFGIENLQRDETAHDLATALPTFRYEAICYMAEDLAKFAPHAPQLMEALDAIIQEWALEDPIEMLILVDPLVRFAPEQARRYTELLRSIMQESGRDVRDPLSDGQVVKEGDAIVAKSGPTYPSIVDYHAIRATLLILDLYPGDVEARRNLRDWTTNHPEEQVRKELEEKLVQYDTGAD